MTTRNRFWRPGSLAGEAFRRIATSHVRLLVLVAASGIEFSAALALDHQAVSQTLRDHRNALTQGIGVVVIDNVPMTEHDRLRAAWKLLGDEPSLTRRVNAVVGQKRSFVRSKEWLIETASTTELELDHVAAPSDISKYQIRPALADDPRDCRRARAAPSRVVTGEAIQPARRPSSLS